MKTLQKIVEKIIERDFEKWFKGDEGIHPDRVKSFLSAKITEAVEECLEEIRFEKINTFSDETKKMTRGFEPSGSQQNVIDNNLFYEGYNQAIQELSVKINQILQAE